MATGKVAVLHYNQAKIKEIHSFEGLCQLQVTEPLSVVIANQVSSTLNVMYGLRDWSATRRSLKATAVKTFPETIYCCFEVTKRRI